MDQVAVPNFAIGAMENWGKLNMPLRWAFGHWFWCVLGCCRLGHLPGTLSLLERITISVVIAIQFSTDYCTWVQPPIFRQFGYQQMVDTYVAERRLRHTFRKHRHWFGKLCHVHDTMIDRINLFVIDTVKKCCVCELPKDYYRNFAIICNLNSQFNIFLQIYPEWKAFQIYQTNIFQKVLRVDATARSRPMSTYADNPKAVKALFDSISYEKGRLSWLHITKLKSNDLNTIFFSASSVLYMWLHAFGEKTFKKALTYYLNEQWVKCQMISTIQN